MARRQSVVSEGSDFEVDPSADWDTAHFVWVQGAIIFSLLANCRVDRYHTDDLLPNVPISCLRPDRVVPQVQGPQKINCSMFKICHSEPQNLRKICGGKLVPNHS